MARTAALGAALMMAGLVGTGGCSGSNASDAGPPPFTLACVLSPICQGGDTDGGCYPAYNHACLTAPQLTCTAQVQCPPSTPGFICRDVPACRQTCVTDKCPPPTSFPDGGSQSLVDGGLCESGTNDCAQNTLLPHCVYGVCQECGADSDCSGGNACVDLDVQRGCNTASDCPGTVGQFACQ